jgi:hypothetical protein
MRKVALVFLLTAGIMPATLVLAQSSSSTNFQNTDSSILPLIVNTQSGNFQIDGSLEPIVGNSVSGNFGVESGAQNPTGSAVVVPPVIPPTSGGGGGGGLPLPATGFASSTATINPHRWTYRPTALVQGMRGTTGAIITLNGSADSVVYPDADHWQRLLPLGLGDNVFYIQANGGERVFGMVHRRLIGDVNDNRIVDDVDLSLFTRHWKNFDIQSDFNEDNAIDDIDLSLLASHWGRSY